jgi:hypothetical protein
MSCAALIYTASEGAWWEWLTTTDVDQFLWRERRADEWQHRDARARAAWLADQLLSSTAVVPEQILARHDLELEQTYDAVARRLRPAVTTDEGSGVPTARAASKVLLHIH